MAGHCLQPLTSSAHPQSTDRDRSRVGSLCPYLSLTSATASNCPIADSWSGVDWIQTTTENIYIDKLNRGTFVNALLKLLKF